MSETQQAEEADGDGEQQLTKSEFFERLRFEGVTLDGSLYAAKGTGKQTRYFEYALDAVKGTQPVRDDDGEVISQEVVNHDEAKLDSVTKSDLEEQVFPKVQDGFGMFGYVIVESSADEGGSSEPDSDYEPQDDEDVVETIRNNLADHGLFAEDDDGEPKVVSLAHPSARLMGYVTGSHVKALPNDMETVDDYRAAVIRALPDDVLADLDIDGADDVPICTPDMMETFYEAGNQMDEETRDRLATRTERRWEDGEYDHLKTDDAEEDENEDEDAED